MTVSIQRPMPPVARPKAAAAPAPASPARVAASARAEAPAQPTATGPSMPRRVVGGLVDGVITITRHPEPAMMGTMLGGGVLATAALMVGISSGAVVAVAGGLGAALGAWGLARVAALFTGR